MLNDISGAVMAIVSIGLTLTVAAAIIAVWPVMISLGIIHTYVVQVPPLGFWTTGVLLLALFTVLRSVHGGTKVETG